MINLVRWPWKGFPVETLAQKPSSPSLQPEPEGRRLPATITSFNNFSNNQLWRPIIGALPAIRLLFGAIRLIVSAVGKHSDGRRPDEELTGCAAHLPNNCQSYDFHEFLTDFVLCATVHTPYSARTFETSSIIIITFE